MTASSVIVHPARTKTLMAFHKIYQSWAWTGGHVDGETDLLHVAMREARENGHQAAQTDWKRRGFAGDSAGLGACEAREGGRQPPAPERIRSVWADDSLPLRVAEDENSRLDRD